MFDMLKEILYKHKKTDDGKDSPMPQEVKEKQSEDVPTLQKEGVIFQLTELKVKIHTLGEEAHFIRTQEKRLGNKYRRSQSKIISKYLESDETFFDNTLPEYERFKINYATEEEAKCAYDNLRMRHRYQRAKNTAKEKHPEVFIETNRETYEKARLHLYDHRTGVIRVESRECLLAYGFIRNHVKHFDPIKKVWITHEKPYAKIESNPRWKKDFSAYGKDWVNIYEPNWTNVAKIVSRFAIVPGDKVKRKAIEKILLNEINIWKSK